MSDLSNLRTMLERTKTPCVVHTDAAWIGPPVPGEPKVVVVLEVQNTGHRGHGCSAWHFDEDENLVHVAHWE